MTSNNSKTQTVTNQAGGPRPNSVHNCNTFCKPNVKIGYAHLEKGLLLFTCLNDTSGALKHDARVYAKLLSRQICYDTIIGNRYHNKYQCQFDHSENFRQTNLCGKWYKNRCTQKDCEWEHFFEASNAQLHINNPTDLNVWNLIRFLRSFASHFKQSVIADKDLQSLYKEITVLMTHIVGCAFPSIEKLRSFLHETLINQLDEKILQELDHYTPYNVPKVVFASYDIDFNSKWYIQSTPKVVVDFARLSPEFTDYLSKQLNEYYTERLQERGNRSQK